MSKDSYAVSESFGYLSREEVEFIKECVRDLPDNPVAVNIGAGAGTSGLAILETRADITLYTVDKSKGGPLGGLEGEMNALRESGINFRGRYNPILGDSKVVGLSFDHALDFLFVDGDHSREGVRGDFELWIPKIKKGGLLLVDDYKSYKKYFPHEDTWPEVTKAVDELLMSKYELIGIHDSVIGFVIND